PLRFAIVTANNPDGNTQSRAANEAADAALLHAIVRAGLIHFRVTGGSADFSHAEPGFGIALDDPSRAVSLGREFRQEAIFWIEGDTVYLHSCAREKASLIGAWS